MPSTYTVNLGIEKPATGEQSGTWGDTTNLNFDILDQAINGAISITLASAGTSGSPNTLAISDGATSDGRNKWIEFVDGGDLGATAYVQLTPNDAEKIVLVRNSLSGSRSVILFQGTYDAGRDLEVPAGVDMLVKFSGGGATATTTNVFQRLRVEELNIAGTTTVDGVIDDDTMATASATKLSTSESIKAYVDTQVGANNELSEVLANGNTSGGNAIQMTTTDELQFRDTALKISSSADGQLDIDADTEIEIVAPTVDIDASTEVNISGDLKVDTDTLYVDSANNRVGIRTGSPSASLHSVRDAGAGFRVSNSTSTSFVSSQFVDDAGSGLTVTSYGSGYASGSLLNVGAGGVALSSSTDMAINSAASKTLRFGTANSERMRISATGDITFYDTSGNASFVYDESAGSTFNEQGDNKDFRVESDSNANMLFVDAGNDRVAIGTLTTTEMFNVGGSVELRSTSINLDFMETGVADANFRLRQNTGNFFIQKLTDDKATSTEYYRADGGVGNIFNDNSVDIDFRVESDSNANMLFVDAGANAVQIAHSSALSIAPLNVQADASGARAIRIIGRSDDYGEFDFYENDNTTILSRIQAHTSAFNIRTYDPPMVLQVSGSTDAMRLTSTDVVVNEGGANRDFRVESDNSTHMLFVDAGSNVVGLGTSSTTSGRGDVGVGGMMFFEPGGTAFNTTNPRPSLKRGGDGAFQIAAGSDADSKVQFYTAPSSGGTLLQRFVVNPNGDVGVEPDVAASTNSANNPGKLRIRGYGWDTLRGSRSQGWAIESIGTYSNPVSGQVYPRLNFQVKTSDDAFNDTTVAGWTYISPYYEFFTNGGAVFNDGSYDADFRVESNNYSHCFFVNAGNDTININSSTAQNSSLSIYAKTSGTTSNWGQGGYTALSTAIANTVGAIGQIGFVNVDSAGADMYCGMGAVMTSGGGVGIADLVFFAKDNGSNVASKERMRISGAAGHVVINDQSYDQDFRVESDANNAALFVDGFNSSTGFGTLSPSGAYRITVNGGILADGDHGLINDSNEFNFAHNLSVSTQIYINYDDLLSGNTIQSYGFYAGNGSSTFVPLLASAFTVSSDYRLKENVTSLSDGITRLKQLSPKRFTWVENNPMGMEPAQIVDGFLAHEVQDVIPEAVHGEKDAEIGEKGDGYQRLDQAKLVPLLTAALQEAITKIETLEARIAALENA